MTFENKKITILVVTLFVTVLVFLFDYDSFIEYKLIIILTPLFLSAILGGLQELLLRIFKKGYRLTQPDFVHAFFHYWQVWVILFIIGEIGNIAL